MKKKTGKITFSTQVNASIENSGILEFNVKSNKAITYEEFDYKVNVFFRDVDNRIYIQKIHGKNIFIEIFPLKRCMKFGKLLLHFWYEEEMNDVCLSNDADCELIVYLSKKYHMSNFEEKTHLGGFDNSEDYLNYLSNEDSDVTLHKEEDVEENDEILFVVNKNSIYDKAKSLLNIFYSSYNNKDCSWNECEYRYTYLNDVLFIETCEDEFIEALFSLDNNERALFDDFKIEIEIDPYYSRAEIKAFLKDDFFIM